jgi:hypothetical protein
LLRLEKDPRYYVMRLPPHHLSALQRCTREELTALGGRLKGHVWAKKHRAVRCFTSQGQVEVA